MAQLTTRDWIWRTALVLRAQTEAGEFSGRYGLPGFTAKDVLEVLEDVEAAPDPSRRTVRDVLVSMAKLGELTRRGGSGSLDFYFRAPRERDQRAGIHLAEQE